MKKLIIILLVCFTAKYSRLNAQHFIQERNFTPISDHLEVKDIAFDAINNRYFTVHNLSLDRISLVGYNNTVAALLTSKLMSALNLQLKVVKVKSSGAFTYVLFYTFLPSGLRTPCIAKINNLGYTLVYAKYLVHSFFPRAQNPTDLDILNDEVYITGTVDNGTTFDDPFLLKLSITGVKVYNKYYSVANYYDVPYSIDVKGTDILIGGASYNNVLNDKYIFIQNLDLNGNVLAFTKYTFNLNDPTCSNNRFASFHVKRDINNTVFGVAKTFTNNKAACFVVARFASNGIGILDQNMVHPDFISPSPFYATVNINSDFDFLENTNRLVVSGTARPNQAGTPHSHMNLLFDKSSIGLPLGLAKLYLQDAAFTDVYCATNNNANDIVNTSNKPLNNNYYRLYKVNKNAENSCDIPLTFGNCNCPLIKANVTSSVFDKVTSSVVDIPNFVYANYNNTSVNVCYTPNLADPSSKQLDDLQIIKNPYSNSITINSSSSFSAIEILDCMGKVIYKAKDLNKEQLMIRSQVFSTGVFILKAWSNNTENPVMKKFVINQ